MMGQLFKIAFYRGRGVYLLAKSTFLTVLLATTCLASSESTARVGFEIHCAFSHSISDSSAIEINISDTVAFSSAKHPPLLGRFGESVMFEIEGSQGARHFVQPSLGGVLAGQFITIFSDGRSIRTQHYATEGETLGVHSEQGHCEVKE